MYLLITSVILIVVGKCLLILANEFKNYLSENENDWNVNSYENNR